MWFLSGCEGKESVELEVKVADVKSFGEEPSLLLVTSQSH